MFLPILYSPVVCVLLAGILIAGLGESCAHAQTSSGRRLVFSTYLGGSQACASGGDPLTFAQSAASDAQGDTYVTGATQACDFPTLNAFQSAPATADTMMSAFVAKYDPTGRLLWSTYLGGGDQSLGVGVAAMPGGGVAVSGVTTSGASSPFPTKNAYQGQNNGQSDYFLAVFDANGNLLYATYLGGSGVEGPPSPDTFTDDNNGGDNVAVDANGLVYVTGTTASGDKEAIPFPVTSNAIQAKLKGGTDAFLCVIDPTRAGSASLVYASFLGGEKDEKGHAVTVAPGGGRVVLGGYTNSQLFPSTANALRGQAPPSGYISNGFVSQVASSQPGSPSSQYSLSYSTYLGGNTVEARDDVYGLFLDASGLIVATGRTESADFPMAAGGAALYKQAPYLVPGPSGDDEPYVVKINPDGISEASLVYATFLGGGSPTNNWGSFCTCVGVDGLGAIYVGGQTSATGQAYAPPSPPYEAPETFPYTNNSLSPRRLQGAWDALFMQINPGGAGLDYSTYLGGSLTDRVYGLAVDSARNVVLSGLTFSKNFPLKNPAQGWPGNAGSSNAFVTKFALDAPGIAPFLLLLEN